VVGGEAAPTRTMPRAGGDDEAPPAYSREA
jgi:hypothetical protein